MRCWTNNEIKLHGERYRILIVPPVEAIPYATLAKVKEFYDRGGTVIGYGFRPSKSATLGKSSKDIVKLCNAIWGDPPAVEPGISERKALAGRDRDAAQRRLRDLLPRSESQADGLLRRAGWICKAMRSKLRVINDYQEGWLHILHRVKAGRDVFMITNQHHEGPPREFLMLASAEGVPELWDPMRNEITAVPFQRHDAKRIIFELALEPLETVLLVFQPKGIERPMRIEPGMKPARAPIMLKRSPNPPSEPPTPDMKRKPLTLSPVKAADPFRGRAVIPADVDLARCRVYLEMQDLPGEAAAVTVNGVQAGGLIGRPLRLDITRHVKPGENTVKIEPLAPKAARLAFYPSGEEKKEAEKGAENKANVKKKLDKRPSPKKSAGGGASPSPPAPLPKGEGSQPRTADNLAAQFRHPPDSARPWVYWFWLDGNITREGITADLEAMKRVGIGGVLIMEVDQGIPKGPVRFGSPQWRELFKHVVAEAGRLGLKVNMNNDAGWCGSGGPWIKPEHAMQKLVWTETAVEGPRRFEGPLPQPETVANFYRDAAVLAFPTPPADADPKTRARIARIDAKNMAYRRNIAPRDNNLTAPGQYAALPADAVVPREGVVDLTARLGKDGRLAWDVPAGQWTVLRMGYTPTGKDNHPAPVEGRGLECDKLSREAVDVHFAGLMGKLIADVGPLAGKTLTTTHIDSWEVHTQNWTPRFREEFRRRRGYDMTPLLPAMTGRVVGSLEVSERFLWDVRRTICEMLLENYAGHFRELAAKHGMRLSIEAYGDGPCDDWPTPAAPTSRWASSG